MEQTYRQSAREEVVEPSSPGVSWPAVGAGAVTSLALTLVLLSFGAGVGLSVVSPWGNSGMSSTKFEIGTGLYFIVMAMISSAIGGYLSGRLRTKWVGVQTTEVHFRDTAHGFLAWAAASVLGAVLLASPATSLVGGALRGATQSAANSAQTSSMDNYVDTLLRSDNPSAQGQQSSSDPRGEKRVKDVVNQVTADQDNSRKATMQTAIWLTLSLFIGAFSASLAATEGGGLRDGTWGKKKAYVTTAAINR
jgi:hypothetical protein